MEFPKGQGKLSGLNMVSRLGVPANKLFKEVEMCLILSICLKKLQLKSSNQHKAQLKSYDFYNIFKSVFIMRQL